jgi:hypothetical protein
MCVGQHELRGRFEQPTPKEVGRQTKNEEYKVNFNTYAKNLRYDQKGCH